MSSGNVDVGRALSGPPREPEGFAPHAIVSWSALDWKWLIVGACVAFTVYIAVIPLGFLLWQSFRTPQTAAVDAVFTFENYFTAYGSLETLRLFWTSLQFAAGTAIFAFLLGTTLAWMNERTNTPFKALFFALSLIPLVIPSILFTISWIFLASPQIGILKEELKVPSEVLVLDGIRLWDFDYIDLGRVRMPSFTVPVTIKSLVLSHDPRVPHTHGHHHHHPSA